MRATFAHALDLALAATPIPTADIASRVGVSRDAVRKWATNKGLPDPLTVFGLEQLLGLPPGEPSRHLGYMPAGAPPSVPAAIEADPLLLEALYGRWLGDGVAAGTVRRRHAVLAAALAHAERWEEQRI